jgi:hypothetical protein
MWNRCVTHRVAVLTAALLGASMAWATSRNFVPDVRFSGSSLTGWRTLGEAAWRAQDGEIIGTKKPSGSGGWLVSDHSYQDVAFFASFRCPATCKAGVLLRGEKTPEGGMKGIYVSLAQSELASYRIVLDAQGKELTRVKLRPASGRQSERFAPPQSETASPPAARARPLAMPGGIPAPISPPDTRLRPGEWNTIEVTLDANVIRVFINNGPGNGDGEVSGGVADEVFGRYGPLALYAGDEGEVRFKDVAYKDLRPRVAEPEKVSSRFGLQRLNEFYYSWGPDVADINHDGKPDVVAGPYYYLGPDYNVAKEIYYSETLNPSNQYFAGNQHAYDFTGDGWPDVLNGMLGSPAVLYVNPKGEERRWDVYNVTVPIRTEITLLKDVDGDGNREFVFKDENTLVYAKPDPANPTGTWITRRISEPGPWASHGLGVGDVNGDGRMDILNPYGWWQGPVNGAGSGPWTYHPESFGRWTGSVVGGAEIAVYDVNGDGFNDVVTSLQAHGWGLAWYEQKRSSDGRISFQQHMIMDDFSTKNAGGVTFSQLHGSTSTDIDGDRLPDFITGKRLWSHHTAFSDPDPHGPAVLYVYRTVRNPKAPGGAEFVPELVHNRSGVGQHIAVADLNNDGAMEIVTSTKQGTFIFWNNWKKPR